MRAADFRRAIERLFRVRLARRELLRGHRRRRPLPAATRALPASRDGIATDDRTGSVTFRLRSPDPDFLFKLTVFSYAAPIPPGVPDRDAGARAGSGHRPRTASRAGPAASFDMERNPYFHEWSHAAQPAGNPDAIAWRFVESFDAAARDVEGTRGDWLLGLLPPAQLPAHQARAPGAGPHEPVADLRVHPAQHARCRRSTTCACGARSTTRSTARGSPACTAGPASRPRCARPLMPGLPGYRPYCPYRAHLAKARALRRRLRHARAADRRLGHDRRAGIPRELPAYIASVLRSLGYRVRLHLVPSRASRRPSGARSSSRSTATGWPTIPRRPRTCRSSSAATAASRTATSATGGSTG